MELSSPTDLSADDKAMYFAVDLAVDRTRRRLGPMPRTDNLAALKPDAAKKLVERSVAWGVAFGKELDAIAAEELVINA